jgi:hypothetical protein
MLLELNVKAKRERVESTAKDWNKEELEKLMQWYDEYQAISAAKLKAAILSGNYD